MIVGLTSGCFDLIHIGHVRYLERCRKQCDRLIVAVDSDMMVREAKGLSRPVITFMQRCALVESLECVHIAQMLTEVEELDNISSRWHVKKLFKHEGFKRVDNVWGLNNGKAELVIVPDEPGLISTTEIIDRIRKR